MPGFPEQFTSARRKIFVDAVKVQFFHGLLNCFVHKNQIERLENAQNGVCLIVNGIIVC